MIKKRLATLFLSSSLFVSGGTVCAEQPVGDQSSLVPPSLTLDLNEEWSTLQSLKIDRFVGKSIDGVPMSPEILLTMTHILGPSGLDYFLRTGSYDDDLARVYGGQAKLSQVIHMAIAQSVADLR